ncbi:MAG: 23S rRNA (pseudouridine(1915)-N(3))-methyltransferase RlmH [Alphaproteobacteria bacterium]
MNLTIIAIDKMKNNAPEKALIDTYIRQCGWNIKIIELQASKGMDGIVRQNAESELLLKHIPRNSKVVVLDEKGQNLSSRQFASTLIEWRDNSIRDVALLIGGADGHTDDVRKKADLILSFGKMTLPHLLMRAVLCEQLYRAYTISIGHPYHRD